MLLDYVKIQGLDPLIPYDASAVDQLRERQVPRASNGLGFGFVDNSTIEHLRENSDWKMKAKAVDNLLQSLTPIGSHE